MSQLKKMTHVDVTEVPYKGGILGVQDLVAGHIQYIFSDSLPVMQFIKAGRFDVVQTWVFAANAYGRVAAHLAKTPVVRSNLLSPVKVDTHSALEPSSCTADTILSLRPRSLPGVAL